MVFPPASVILFLVLGAVPPLGEDERARVAGAVDGADGHGDAFATLVANAERWTPGLGDTPVRMAADVDALLADPAAARGELFRLTGTLEQQSWLPAPDDAIAEWFVRDGAGRPILVYVCGLDPDHAFHDGLNVTLPARFYKRVDDRARDGRARGYAAFVGAVPATGRTSAGLRHLWIVVVPVAVMLVVFLALLVYAGRGGRPARRGVRFVPSGNGGPPLPDDPADALAELRRRAETPGP